MIYTFYSYKGGVGRSMALANVAEYFYSKGLRVVMVDWDLEAPGLENFFATDPSELEAVRSQPGLIDMLVSYKRLFPKLPMPRPTAEAGPTFATGDAGGAAPSEDAAIGKRQSALEILDETLPPVSALLRELRPPSVAGEKNGLRLLSAGWRSGERFTGYAQEVQDFDWVDFYRAFAGEAYFEWLRRQLLGEADAVLIDSRTGVTEMGGVCARQLADVVVSFCAPNAQNVVGVTAMLDSFRRPEVLRARQRPLDSVIVPARLDNSETALRNAFERRFKDLLEDPPRVFRELQRSFWDLRIPYVPKYAYEEKLAIGAPDRAEDLEDAYRRLAVHLAVLAPPGSGLRQRLTSEFQAFFPPLVPDVYVAYAAGDGELARRVCDRVREAGIRVWEDLGAAEAISAQQLTDLVEHARHLVLVTSQAAQSSQALRRQGLEARRHGLPILVLGAGGSEGAPAPAWLRHSQVLDPERDWELIVRLLEGRKPVLRSPLMAPPLPPALVPPAELADLKATIVAGAEAADTVCVALVGPGGSGKTVLAAAACREDEVIGRFDGILWLSFGRRPQLREELAGVLAALTGRSSEAPDESAAVGELSEALGGRRCLLVIDDVVDARHLKPLTQVLPQTVLIVTTRDSEVALALGARIVTLARFAPTEARLLLARGLEIPAESLAAADRLAARLEYLPLALDLAGRELRRRVAAGAGVAEALDALAEELARRGTVAFDPLGHGDETAGSLGGVIAESLNRLAQDDRDRYLRLARAPQEELAFAEATRLLQLDDDDAKSWLQRLAARSLLSLDPASGAMRIPGLIRAHVQQVNKPRAPMPPSGLDQARAILRGQTGQPAEMLKLAKDMKKEKRFGVARRLLWRARSHPDFDRASATGETVLQQLALCTYKDPDLPLDQRLDGAFEILSEVDDLATTSVQETLGLAGAIFKRKWEVDAQTHHLERSASYYMRGYQAGNSSDPQYDFGYTGINASFVLDLLASEEDRQARAAGTISESAAVRRGEARRIREELASTLPALMQEQERTWLRDQWWFLVTLGEACFGLGRYPEARSWLLQAATLSDVPDWERETTARQLAYLARLRGELESEGAIGSEEAEEVLRAFLGGDATALRSAVAGKVGLALSGGGFRSSLFHIGVLARLAEIDALRNVEVLSCVSGGAIVGAHYYLELRRLLAAKPDGEITRDDYVEIVRRLERDFLAGVQTNIRTRVASDPFATLKMIFSRHYSRTQRVGELFEEAIFSRVADGEGDEPRWLNELFIRPKDEPDDFSPKLHNWRRRAKVPILVLNATTLNTGHNWQFTASWMGEPPGRIDTRIDGNDRLRRLYYRDAPPPHHRIRLGHAVAASSCVPGLFEPLVLAGLYPERTVRLVDGGVHDNQGIGALMEEDCNVLLVSDASGQMQTVDDPGAGVLAVPLRANSILQARVRVAQHHEVSARRRSGLVRGLMFVHLKKDLDVDPVNWIGCVDLYDAYDAARPAELRGTLTSYGIRKEVQNHLAGIRTDLDAFCDAEAYALMTSGYRMTEHELRRAVPAFKEPRAERPEWRFLRVEEQMTRDAKSRRARTLERVLAIGSRPALRGWLLSPALRGWTYVALVAAALAIGFLFAVQGSTPAFDNLVDLANVLILVTTILVGARILASKLALAATVKRLLLGFGLLAAWIPAWLQLSVLDRVFLRAGRVPVEEPDETS